MRVLLLAHEFDRSEARLFSALASRGAEIQCLADPAAERLPQLLQAGVKVENLVCRNRVDLPAASTIRHTVRHGSFNLIHALSGRTLSCAVIGTAGLGVPIVTYRGTVGHLSRWDPASQLSYLNRKVKRIICVSEAVRRYLISLRVPAEHAVTIHKGHDVSWYTYPRQDLAEFGIPPAAPVIGCAANARPVKGVDLLVQASIPVMARRPDAHLLLVGELRDAEISRLIERHPHRDRVHAVGFRKDAPALMGACRVFVMPSRAREGLPKAAIEAMSQRVAPIVSDAGGLPELVVNGKCGWVFPAGDIPALSAALEDALSDPARLASIGNAAHERIVTDFNIERTIERTMEVWRSAVQPSA